MIKLKSSHTVNLAFKSQRVIKVKKQDNQEQIKPAQSKITPDAPQSVEEYEVTDTIKDDSESNSVHLHIPDARINSNKNSKIQIKKNKN